MSLNYITGLNGIRAIAVLLVIIAHRFPKGNFLHTFPLGSYGVNIFFVLSGFLISRILFNSLSKKENSFENNLLIIKNFILRRALRIFPLYYALLIFMFFTDGIIGNNFRENFYWYLFYASNYLNYCSGKWFGALAHLWSLAVEEQFYIFYPLFLLFIFRSKILVFITLLILIGTISPYFIEGQTYVLTICCINAFGVGALLAYFEIYSNSELVSFQKIIGCLAVLSLSMIIFNTLILSIPFFPERLAISIIGLFLIEICMLYSTSIFVQKILNNALLNLIGVVSYGVYLFHNVVPKYWTYAKAKLGCVGDLYAFSYIEFILQTCFIIVLSYISWILFEKPILSLKKYLKD